MKNRTIIVVACMCAFFGTSVYARNYSVSVLKKSAHRTQGEIDHNINYSTSQWKSNYIYKNIQETVASEKYLIKIGEGRKEDDKSLMEIKCATIIQKVAEGKEVGINDIESLRFDPINVGTPIYFVMETGSICSYDADYTYVPGKKFKGGWKILGYIIELSQNGKVIKHFSNVSGAIGKTHLTGEVKQFREKYYDDYLKIYAADKNGKKVDLDEVLDKFRDKSATEVNALLL